MSTVDLVRELESAGVQMWEDDGRLRFRAPKGLMTEERLRRLREEKEAVLAYVRAAEPRDLQLDPEARLEPFPLSDVQAAYLLGRRDVFAYGRVACHGYGELEFPELDPARLQDAWAQMIERHDMLRAVVAQDGSQRVLERVPPYRVVVRDLRGASPRDVRGALLQTRDEMDHRVPDPESWPLFELRVTRSDERTYLHLSIDFLIADFVSIQLLLDELMRRYDNPGLELAPLQATFRDYLLTERRLRNGPRYERDREWWLARLEGFSGAPELPILDRARDAPPRFVRHRMLLEEGDWAALRTRASGRGVTPSAAVLAAYAAVIGRWSRRARFTLNLTLLNRLPLHPQIDEVIGDFTAVELLEVADAGGVAFAQGAREVQAQLFEDLDHRLFSGVEVIREIGRRDGAGSALFPVVFTSAIGLAQAGRGPDEAASLGELGYGISQTPQVWIDCQVMERGGCLSLNWDVREGVFPEGVVEAMFAAFQTLLRRLAESDEAWEDRDPVALPAGQAEARERVNSTAAPLPDGLLHEGAIARALAQPERLALVDARGPLRYGELLERAQGVAGRLAVDGGCAGERVAVVMDKGAEQVIAVLGVLLSGAAYVPIDAAQPPARRDAMLARAAIRRVLCDPARAAGPWPEGVEALAVDRDDAPLAAGPAPAPTRGSPDDLAYVIFTSGSTGTPKGVMISHRAALNTIADVSRRYGIGAEDRVLGLAALGFDLSVYDVFGTLALGGCLVLPDPRRAADPSHWARLIAEHGVTVWNSVPAQLQMLSDYLRAERDVELPSLRLAMLSGDWIPVALPDEVRARIPGLRLISMGGATEAAIWSIYHPIEEVPPSWHSIPYGVPLANQTMHVRDERMRPCPDWVVGELYIGGAGLAVGYLGDEEQTAARFVTDPLTGERLYRTGDLGRRWPDGVIEFLGREDFQVKIRGHRIELAEIEAAIAEHPAVGAVAVLAHGDHPLERRLAAFVEPRAVDPGSNGVAASADGDRAAARVLGAAEQAGRAAMAGVDTGRCLEYFAALNDCAVASMMDVLRGAGLFAAGQTHTAEEVVRRLQAAPGHHRLVRRWLGALVTAGALARDADGRYAVAASEHSDAALAWARVERLRAGVDEGAVALHEYFRSSAAHLPALLRGESDPLALLFPQGGLDVADALYRDSLLNRWSTAMLAGAVRAAGAQSDARPLRVLEVGAGVGGSTMDVLAALGAEEVDYLFTDLSAFFINSARERFASEPYVRYALFDLDQDYRIQGLAPNSFDVIVAADVLHSTRSVDDTLARLCELAAPGGWLVFAEMTRDQLQIMVSLELMTRVDGEAGDFLDARRGRDQTFLTREQWLDALAAAGAADVVAAPDPGDPLSELGLQVFAARVKADRSPLRPQDVLEHAAGRLPDYMVPPQVQVLDALPLTANGKLDHRRLRSWLARPAAAAGGAARAPETETERRVAAVWAELFGVPEVDRDTGFFELGGDSLLAAQVAGRLRETVAEASGVYFDDLLRMLLQGPSVADLAAQLARGDAATPEQASEEAPPTRAGEEPALVVLAEGEGPATLLLDGDGTASRLDGLVRRLAERGSVIGLATGTADARRADDGAAIDRAAAAHARHLSAQGHRTLHVVGLGAGAMLALETARHLLEAGGEVRDLVVLGAPPTDAPSPYLGDVAVLEPQEDDPVLRDATLQCWRDCALGEVTPRPVPGRTATAVAPEHADALADAILATARAGEPG